MGVTACDERYRKTFLPHRGSRPRHAECLEHPVPMSFSLRPENPPGMATSNANDLVIVESPAKAKTIEKYLGPGFTVLSSFGHVRD
ncbi:MAG: hypothetical protein KBF49_01870, partial [Flavobacteriales bacterium]|nr:hypothetical protein [Flavobacteriales bacterium]